VTRWVLSNEHPYREPGPIATFPCAANSGRHRGIADMAGLVAGSTRSRMTHFRHWIDLNELFSLGEEPRRALRSRLELLLSNGSSELIVPGRALASLWTDPESKSHDNIPTACGKRAPAGSSRSA
jgi:hypothetical protein